MSNYLADNWDMSTTHIDPATLTPRTQVTLSNGMTAEVEDGVIENGRLWVYSWAKRKAFNVLVSKIVEVG